MSAYEQVNLAIIGGSGLYHVAGIEDIARYKVETPFGAPSCEVVVGTWQGVRVAFLARHGLGHVHAPSSIPQRANIYALKLFGVRYIIGVNACGSLREDYAPSHIVIPDQIFDYTLNRGERSFFEGGIVAHVSVAEPYDASLSAQLHASALAIGATAHKGGTFLIEDGNRFATRAESLIFKAWGCSIIGMTTAPEAFLAREAEIAYATLAHVTDYDSWHESEAPVTTEMVMATFKGNIANVQATLAHAVAHFDASAPAPAHSALSHAIMTAPERISATARERLRPIVARALGL
jgi:5'-methylthioadenosine phosphorylase